MTSEIIKGSNLRNEIENGKWSFFKYSEWERTYFIKKRFLWFFTRKIKKTTKGHCGVPPDKIHDNDLYYVSADITEKIISEKSTTEYRNPIVINLTETGIATKMTIEQITACLADMPTTAEIVNKSLENELPFGAERKGK